MIILEKISKNYNGNKVIDNFDLKIEEGEIIAFLSPSGSGKTTLIECLSGLKKIDNGKIINYKKNISVIFQEDRLLPWKTSFDNVNLISKNKKITENLLIMSGIEKENFLKFPDELSGGMKKRINICRGLSAWEELLIMDEPFTGINKKIKDTIMDYIKNSLNKKSCIFITHDVKDAFYFSNKVILMNGPPLKISKIYEKFEKNNIENLIKEIEKTL